MPKVQVKPCLPQIDLLRSRNVSPQGGVVLQTVATAVLKDTKTANEGMGSTVELILSIEINLVDG